MPNASMAQANSASAPYTLGGWKLTKTSAIAAIAYIRLSVLMPPMRSASAPPIGRTSEPQNTQAAVKYPACTASRP
jgi:hypothetical protein